MPARPVAERRGLSSLRRLLRRHLPAIVVLLVGLGLTFLIARQLDRTIESKDEERFVNAVDRLQDAIERRLIAYTDTLRASAGLFDASGRFSRGEMRAFVRRLDLQRRYPGIRGVGFSARILPADLDRVIRDERIESPAFAIRPDGPRSEYHAILFLEPLDERNEVAIGYDMYTDATRRAAMERARDSGQAAASGPVELVQEIDQDKQPGFLIYVPVYAGGGIPGTLEERRRALRGFVYSPFRIHDLFAGILGADSYPRAGFELADADVPDVVLFRSHAAAAPDFFVQRTFDVSGRRWVASFFSLPGLAQTSNAGLVPVVAWTGAVLSVLFALLVGSQTAARRRLERAERAARRHAEAMERARAEAEGLNRLKDAFLATVTHELRTPLNAMRGWLQILQQDGMPEERRQQALETVVRNTEMQSRLIDDLLDMSRITAGRLRIETAEVGLAGIIDAAIDVVRVAADAKSVAIHTAYQALPAIRADGNRLQQVIWNLLSNAVKFTPSGGHVRVELRRAGGSAEIVVRDDGVGILPAFLPHVFEPFRQAPGARHQSPSGLGLGLSIAKNLVELHGGTVEAISAGPGAGATFVVRLPIRAGEAPPH